MSTPLSPWLDGLADIWVRLGMTLYQSLDPHAGTGAALGAVLVGSIALLIADR